MDDSLLPQFQSYQGLQKIIVSKLEFQQSVKDIIKWIRSHSRSHQEDEKHKSIKLLDTFFSDSLDPVVLSELFHLAKDLGYSIQILLLEPFSEFSTSRAHALKTSAVKEINQALFNIRSGINGCEQSRVFNEQVEQDEFDKFDYILTQLTMIKEFHDIYPVDIRFYDVLTEVPTYIFSQFLAKGLILHGHSAAQNPWMIFVDDRYQQKDIYDRLYDNFNWVWDDAKEEPRNSHPVRKNGIFLSHGRNESATNKISKFVTESLNQKISVFEEQSKVGLTLMENLEHILLGCSKAIIIMTKEDEQKDGKMRARQNVIHELGFCQEKYGRDNVLALVEEGIELPSNFKGTLYKEFIIVNNGSHYEVNIEPCYELIRRFVG